MPVPSFIGQFAGGEMITTPRHYFRQTDGFLLASAHRAVYATAEAFEPHAMADRIIVAQRMLRRCSRDDDVGGVSQK